MPKKVLAKFPEGRIRKKWTFLVQTNPALHTTDKLDEGLPSRGYVASIPMNLFWKYQEFFGEYRLDMNCQSQDVH
jgi:hypothetical protein